jgi:hypothetical protein
VCGVTQIQGHIVAYTGWLSCWRSLTACARDVTTTDESMTWSCTPPKTLVHFPPLWFFCWYFVRKLAECCIIQSVPNPICCNRKKTLNINLFYFLGKQDMTRDYKEKICTWSCFFRVPIISSVSCRQLWKPDLPYFYPMPQNLHCKPSHRINRQQKSPAYKRPLNHKCVQKLVASLKLALLEGTVTSSLFLT